MLLTLMVYVTAVSFVLGCAAWALEHGVRGLAFPTRWIWSVALIGSFGFGLVTLFLETFLGTLAASGAAGASAIILTPVVVSLGRVTASVTPFADLNVLLSTGWAFLSLAVGFALVRAQLQLRSERSTWSSTELDGRRVLVSEDLGPGAVGLFRPRVVVPRWALDMPAAERELMLRHEAEHCNVGDPQRVGAALVLVCLMPWNAALWWQLHRLRLAIEIDCDHRVLRGSPEIRRYSTLLLEIGARSIAPRMSALAFARPTPFLERRIRVMTAPKNTSYARTLGLALLSGLLVVASCQMDEVPEIASMVASDFQAIAAGPVFTPMTVRPEIKNLNEIMASVEQNHPPLLKELGIGGRVVVLFYIGDTGTTLHVRIGESSGNDRLDAAALQVAKVYEFTPALNGEQPVNVWIQLPVTFQVK